MDRGLPKPVWLRALKPGHQPLMLRLDPPPEHQRLLCGASTLAEIQLNSRPNERRELYQRQELAGSAWSGTQREASYGALLCGLPLDLDALATPAQCLAGAARLESAGYTQRLEAARRCGAGSTLANSMTHKRLALALRGAAGGGGACAAPRSALD